MREDSTYKFPTYIPIFLTLTNHLTNLRILQNSPDGARATSVAYIIQQGRKGKDLDYYWKGAVKNLDKELELYELLHDVESMREDEAGSDGTPIEVE